MKENTERTVRDIWDMLEKSNMYITEHSQGEEKEEMRKKRKWPIINDFFKLMKNIKLQKQGNQQCLKRKPHLRTSL